MKRKILLILIPLIVLAIALTGAHILVERLFILIVLVALVSYLFARLGVRGLKGNFKIPVQHYEAGQSFQIEAGAENASLWYKPFLKLKILTEEESSQKDIQINLPSKAAYNWQNEHSFSHRGRYTLGPMVGEASDMFGLFHVHRKLDNVKEMLIYPKTVELPFFLIGSHSEPGLLHSEWLSNENSGAISGVREYVPGDSLSRIHWRSTAHTGKLIVKEFDIDRSEKFWIILDLNKESNYGKGADSTGEYGITIAASIAKKYSDSGRHIGLIAHGDNYHYYPAQQGSLNMWRILEALAVVNIEGQIPFQRIILGARQQMTGNSTAIIITASTQDEVIYSILALKKQGIQVVSILLDASSFGSGSPVPDIKRRFLSARVPLYVIKKGDNLSESLGGQSMDTKAKPEMKAGPFVR
jgi:uncharacterized protein (DUF58 family)